MILASSFALESRPLLRRMLCTYFAKIISPPTPAARAKRRSFSALHCENLGFLEVRSAKVLASHSASNKLLQLSLKYFYQFMALVDLG